ncbi:MAG: helix-turn-helix transcriptional regulator [Candidatus Sericytochromatia bacterium]|nr:helix-turn-helix transcriptional regulator [Candidatus Sericytochromatia bacterium]
MSRVGLRARAAGVGVVIVWKLDALMRARGVKGRELARRLEIGENYLSRIRHEVPERLSLELLDGLCRELGCGIADLLEHRAAGKGRRCGAPKASARASRPPAGREQVEASSPFVEEVLAPLMAELAPVLEGLPPPDEPAPPAPAPDAGTAAPVAGSVVLKTTLLQARLDRLKRRRVP